METKRPLVSVAVLTATAFSAGIQISGWFFFLPLALRSHADFTNIYDAASLVWGGKSNLLYSNSLFNHLAFEAVFLSPLSLLGYKGAYIAMIAINLTLLLIIVRLLDLDWRLTVALFASIPVSVALMQGQDSILTLFAVVAAALLLDVDHELAAGTLIGLTIYKFQFALPILALMLVWKYWRFFVGFAISSLVCVLISAVAVGRHSFFAYFLSLGSMSDSSRFGIVPKDMINIRGLLSAFLTGHVLQVSVVLASALVFAHAAYSLWGEFKPREHFAVAVTTACLVSYHLLIHDLVLVIVPLIFAVRTYPHSRLIHWGTLSLFVAPAAVSFFPQAFFLVCIPLMISHFGQIWVLSDRSSAAALSLPARGTCRMADRLVGR